MIVETELSEQEANSELEIEIQKPNCERDVPRVQRLFRQTFKLRRNGITTFGDGSVKEIVDKFPLLKDPEYV